jgi:hypothetical protein
MTRGVGSPDKLAQGITIHGASSIADPTRPASRRRIARGAALLLLLAGLLGCAAEEREDQPGIETAPPAVAPTLATNPDTRPTAPMEPANDTSGTPVDATATSDRGSEDNSNPPRETVTPVP